MRTRLVRIGNSRGVRLAKPLIAEAGLTDEVEVKARDGTIVISRVRSTRSGWEEAARQLCARNADRLLDPPTATRFDDDEWKW